MILMLTPAISSAYDVGSGLDEALQQIFYHTGEQSNHVSQHDATDPQPISESAAAEGPVRLARFSYVHGSVTWRASDTGDWSSATLNMPIQEGPRFGSQTQAAQKSSSMTAASSASATAPSLSSKPYTATPMVNSPKLA